MIRHNALSNINSTTLNGLICARSACSFSIVIKLLLY
jgi:hypothetical protein